MILGIGSDLVSIPRILETLEAHGERFLNRCFDPVEQNKVDDAAKGNAKVRAAGYAKRWAAKEACAKALGLGIRDDIFLKDIVVVNAPEGKPELVLKAGAKTRLDALTPHGMIPRIDVSLSDDPPMALAFVVISAEKETS